MRKLVLALALLCASTAHAQTTTVRVIATMGGSYVGAPVFLHQITFAGTGTPGYSTFFDAGGNLAITVPGGTYQFTFCNTSGTCFDAAAALMTNTFDMTTIFTNAANLSGAVSTVFGRNGAVTAQTGDYTCAQVTNCSPNIGTAYSSVFNISANCGTGGSNCLQWVDDDSTDNCGTATTNFINLVNSYNGPGIAEVVIGDSANGGKAFKLNSCNLVFTQPRTIYLWANLDCGSGITLANCIQEGPNNLVNFTNAQTPPYTIDGTGSITGCLNVTVACIEAEPWISNPRIKNIHMINVGAGNASPPACTNYAVSFDGHNNAPQLIGTEYWMTDAVTGRCWSVNNRTAAGGGTNTALVAHNTVIAAGNAPNFLTPCGSVGHKELGSATMITDNQFYGFGQDIVLINPQSDTMLKGNLIDQAGCTTGVASASVQFGDGNNGAVVGASIIANYFPLGTGHAAHAMARTTGSTSTISNIQFLGNQVTSGGGTPDIILNTTPCTNCSISQNLQFDLGTTCSVTGAGGGATCSLLAGNDSAGVVAINTGTTPSASGTLTLTFATGGSQAGTAICTANLHEDAINWNARATIIVASGSINTRVFNWDNNAVSLTASQSGAYAVDYQCSKY